MVSECCLAAINGVLKKPAPSRYLEPATIPAGQLRSEPCNECRGGYDAVCRYAHSARASFLRPRSTLRCTIIRPSLLCSIGRRTRRSSVVSLMRSRRSKRALWQHKASSSILKVEAAALPSLLRRQPPHRRGFPVRYWARRHDAYTQQHSLIDQHRRMVHVAEPSGRGIHQPLHIRCRHIHTAMRPAVEGRGVSVG